MKKIIKDVEAYSRKKFTIKKITSLIFFNPGFRVLFFHRIVNFLFYRKSTNLLALFLWQLSTLLTGCHVSPRAFIGSGVIFPHPIGIVVGDGVRIGEGCCIYQNVTIGRRSLEKEGYPCLEDGVTVYANTILVGNIEIGKNSIVGACCFISKNIKQNSMISSFTKI